MKKTILILLVSLGLQTQAQINPCDSVEYAITSTANTNLLMMEAWVNGTCPVNFPCVISDYSWTVCDDNLCYGDTGVTVYFQQFMTTDTIKVCLTTTMDVDTMTYTCIQCDSLVFGPNGWMLLSVSNPVSIFEIQNKIINNKMYDLYGREILKPKGLYIQNNQIKYEQ